MRFLAAVYVNDLPKLGGPLVTEPTPREGALVLPGDADSWEFAKFSLRSTLVSLSTLRDHLCYCHWVISNRVSVASRENLGHNNPVRRVLALFTFRSAAINYVSATTLMDEDMLLHRASGFAYDSYIDVAGKKQPIPGLKAAFEDCIANFKYQTFPEMMDVKQMPKEAPLPMDEDGRLVWQNFIDFFT